MYISIVLGLIIAITIVVIVVAIQLLLKRKAKEVSGSIRSVVPFYREQEYDENVGKQSIEARFISIETDLENSFYERIISSSNEEQFASHYMQLFCEARSLLKRMKRFSIEPDDVIIRFVRDLDNLHTF